MTKIKSNKVSINNTGKSIFSFLSDFNNFEKLMPEQVINWKSTADTCSFTIKGMADLAMRIKSKSEFSEINYVSDGNAPFGFTLHCFLAENGNQTNVQIILNADLSPMLKLMAVRPLQNFINLLVNKLKEIMEVIET